jgi:hypothetical protein
MGKILVEILGAPSRENTRVKSKKNNLGFWSQVILLPITLATRFKPKSFESLAAI